MSKNFTLAEFLHSDTALACNIENLPSWADIERLKRVADTMELVRRILGDNPIAVSSGFRCPALNREVGGVPDSAHLYGLAVDFTCPGFGTPTMICATLAGYVGLLRIDQLIDESGWVHIGLCEPPDEPRGECFVV